jgi:hypothetical protein
VAGRFAVLAGAIAAGLLWLGPPGSDTAAHVYQAWLFRHHGFVLWDNYWYSGRYTFATYSLLYYPVAVVVGIKRGWFRQDDFPENAVLYHRLDLAMYTRWLRERGVRYVLVPRDRPDYSSRREPALASKLHFVIRAGEVVIYELPNATPIAPGGRRRADARLDHAARPARGEVPPLDPRAHVVHGAAGRNLQARLRLTVQASV